MACHIEGVRIALFDGPPSVSVLWELQSYMTQIVPVRD